MKVIEEPFQLRLPRDEARSKGLHLSEILRDLALKSGVLDPKWDVPLVDGNSIMAQIGFAIEDYLSLQHQDIEFHPGEISLDGIAMSPDGLSIADGEDYLSVIGVEKDSWILHEFKSTRKSSRDFREALKMMGKKVLLWLWQIRGYRHALNLLVPEKACLVSKLHVMFLNGNYSRDESDPESLPTYKIYRIHHTEEELESNWRMIVSHKECMERER